MTNTRYVDVDADVGGNGTTNQLTGDNCAYKSLSIWEAARQAVLSDVEECICESNGLAHTADSTAVIIDGWTTTAVYYIYIHTSATARHNGTYQTTKYRLEIANAIMITNLENYVKIDSLQLYMTAVSSTSKVIIQSMMESTTVGEISNCILRGVPNSAYTFHGGLDLTTFPAGAYTVTWKIWNNIFYDFNGTGTTVFGLTTYETSGAPLYVYAYNNTFHNSKIGYYEQVADTSVAKNNLFISCATAASGTFATGTDYNATENASLGYTVTGSGNTHDRNSTNVPGITFTFINEGGDDFHIASTDAGARNYGVNLSIDGNIAFSTDIDGQTRPGESTWDIGADEYVRTNDFLLLF